MARLVSLLAVWGRAVSESLPDMLARLRAWHVAAHVPQADERAVARAKDEALLALPRLLAIAEAAQAWAVADDAVVLVSAGRPNADEEAAAWRALEIAEVALRAALDGSTTEGEA